MTRPIQVPLDRILEVVRRYWGYDELRPLQEEAIRAQLQGRDSLVVLPTGGGKSLCFQVPAVLDGRTDVVISPLISLMKDQVDGLRESGYSAAAVHGGMAADERRAVEESMTAGSFRLVFVAPERLLTPRFMSLLDRLHVRAFSIDEAHCISHWGHDFRPEYRGLSTLRQRFPEASLHAYTATATPRVREDIVAQLGLFDPRVLVGSFDRPNLLYRVVPRVDRRSQVLQAVRRHRGEAVIVYCITRNETESIAAFLQGRGVRAASYHAGMEDEARRRTQDLFAEERLDVVVATVAFGMGIDRSNVRCVIHASMPKSIEHYQQETGRAGRDGLEAECVLFYSFSDVMRWETLIERSADASGKAGEVTAAQLELLRHMRSFCTLIRCRHRTLSEYFGQEYPGSACGACDVCLDEIEGMADATLAAQKILSCVARVRERFGIAHVVDVLLGADTEPIRRWRHHELSTYGLMKDLPRRTLFDMVHQLVDQELLDRTSGERPVLRLNETSQRVLRGERQVRLVRPKARPLRTAPLDSRPWVEVNRGLFEHLRLVRRRLAGERRVPAYVIFSDATLRELARLRPDSMRGLGEVRGVGEKKLASLGPVFLEEIRTYCRDHGLDRG